MRFIKKPATHILLIALLGVAVYSGTFHAPFVFDDANSISHNPLIKNIGNFISRPDGYSAYPTRYVGYLTFALNYRFGGLDVTGYHIVNLAIHLINSLLVYLLVILTFKTKRLAESSIAGSAVWIAFFASALFTVHPVETQAVTYVVQRLTSLATMFYLASLVLFIKARSAAGREMAVRGTALTHYVLSLLFAVLAMKTKEIAFTLPLIVLLYELFFFEGQAWKRLIFLLPMLSTLAIIPVGMIGANEPAGYLLSDLSKAARASSLPRWDYLLTQSGVIVTYIRLLFLPVNQNLDYDYPVSHSFFEPRVYGSFFILASLLGAAVYLLMRSRKGGDAAWRLASFGILWFFITLSVESSVIPILDVIYEHRVYLPSIGMFIALACVFAIAARKYSTAKKFSVAVATAAVLILSVAAYGRNAVWADKVTLWEDNARKSPRSARVLDNLGLAYYHKGWLDKAIQEYRLALKIDLVYELAHKHLGAAYHSKGWLDRAIDEYQLALKLNPDDGEAHYGLGDAYFAKGLVDGAIDEYQLALKIKPDYEGAAGAHNNLGVAYSIKGFVDRAMDEFQLALKINPDDEGFHNNLGRAYNSKGMVDKAIDEFRVALKIRPDNPVVHVNLCNSFVAKGMLDKAIDEYNTVLALSPNEGPTLLKDGLTEEARKELARALQPSGEKDKKRGTAAPLS